MICDKNLVGALSRYRIDIILVVLFLQLHIKKSLATDSNTPYRDNQSIFVKCRDVFFHTYNCTLSNLNV